MSASLEQFKMKWGYQAFTSYSKSLKDITKKDPL